MDVFDPKNGEQFLGEKTLPSLVASPPRVIFEILPKQRLPIAVQGAATGSATGCTGG